VFCFLFSTLLPLQRKGPSFAPVFPGITPAFSPFPPTSDYLGPEMESFGLILLHNDLRGLANPLSILIPPPPFTMSVRLRLKTSPLPGWNNQHPPLSADTSCGGPDTNLPLMRGRSDPARLTLVGMTDKRPLIPDEDVWCTPGLFPPPLFPFVFPDRNRNWPRQGKETPLVKERVLCPVPPTKSCTQIFPL